MKINNTEYRLTYFPAYQRYVKFEPVVEPGYFDIAKDEDMILVETWCKENDCGFRTGWDKFYFETEAQMTMFKLRWS